MKKKWALILVLVAVGAAVTAYILFSRKTVDAANSHSFQEKSAQELLEEFEQDATTAHSRYSEKILRVTGTVIQVADGGSLVLGSKDHSASIVIGLDQRHASDIEKVDPGDSAVFQGVYSGYEATVQHADDLLSSLGGSIQFRSAGLIRIY